MADDLAKLIRNADFRRKWQEDRVLAERTLSRRRARYATDPEYRESIKDSVRKRRKEKTPSDRKRSFNRDRTAVIRGVEVRLLSSGRTAAAIGVSNRTIESWEKKGLIPINRTKDAIGRRWYPSEFVEFLAEQLAGRSDRRCDDWSRRVKDAWQLRQLGDQPIPVVGEHIEDDHD